MFSKILNNRRFRMGSFATVLTVIFIAALIILNMIVSAVSNRYLPSLLNSRQKRNPNGFFPPYSYLYREKGVSARVTRPSGSVAPSLSSKSNVFSTSAALITHVISAPAISSS